MKTKYKKILFSLLLGVLFLSPQIIFAQGLQKAFGNNSPLELVGARAGYNKSDDIGAISGRVINTALTLVGIIFLILMVYAGYLWMTARGEESQVKKAQDIVKSTMIGLVLVLSAYAITVLITRGFLDNPTGVDYRRACYDRNPLNPPCVAGDCQNLNTEAECTTAQAAACCVWE